MSRPLGVGLLGAGRVTQAIHLPTLARMSDKFRVASIMDVDESIAVSVAARVGASATTSQEELLNDPAVDVVAICSPHAFHASQVAAACAAGASGILCEKPFAVSRAEATGIADVAGSAGVPLVVGAMHTYDPGWLQARDECADLLASAHTIRSTIVLPHNDRYEDWATEITSRLGPGPAADLTDPRVRAHMVGNIVLGLIIHDLPLIRAFAPELQRVDYTEFVPPFGAVMSLTASGRSVDLIAQMRPQWRPEWALEVWSEDESVRIEFTPSYVHAGSARALLRRHGREVRLGPWAHNGYEGEWAELYAQVVDGAKPRYPLKELIDDLTYATDIAERASSRLLEASRA